MVLWHDDILTSICIYIPDIYVHIFLYMVWMDIIIGYQPISYLHTTLLKSVYIRKHVKAREI